MWAKILAGVVAALTVVGVGVYVALPSSAGITENGSNCDSCCHKASTPETCFDSHSLPHDTAADASPCCAGCCSAKTPSVDALAACGGGLTAAPTAKAKASKITCCDE